MTKTKEHISQSTTEHAPETGISAVPMTPENHEKVLQTIKKEQEAGGRSKINIYAKDEKHRAKLEYILNPFASMWDIHLGDKKATAHRIDLQHNLKPIFEHQYRAGLRLRQL